MSTAYGNETSRDSSVSIAMGYSLDDLGSIPGRSKRFFSMPQCPDRLWNQLSLLSNGYRGHFPRDKVDGASSKSLTSTSAEVKNGRAIPPLAYFFMAWWVINQAQGQLYFLWIYKTHRRPTKGMSKAIFINN
jgi:hypothetical protein